MASSQVIENTICYNKNISSSLKFEGKNIILKDLVLC